MQNLVLPQGYTYSLSIKTRIIDAQEYISLFRDKELCMEACKKCKQYGKRWGCPPFDFDVEQILQSYKKAKLVAVQITPTQSDLPIELAEVFLIPEKLRLESSLLAQEKLLNGRAFSHVGNCTYCSKDVCQRVLNKPCLHPQLVRPSLESFGFDVVKTLDVLFDTTLQWGRNGKMPPFLMMVCAVFY